MFGCIRGECVGRLGVEVLRRWDFNELPQNSGRMQPAYLLEDCSHPPLPEIEKVFFIVNIEYVKWIIRSMSRSKVSPGSGGISNALNSFRTE
jgi:hypothetical protein